MHPDQQLMRKIAGDRSVPWPDAVVWRDCLLVKDYRMNDFPRTADGRIHYDISDDEYFSWLADYLPKNLPPLNEHEWRLAASIKHGNGPSGFTLGDRGGWYESEAVMRPFFTFSESFAEKPDFSQVAVGGAGFSYENYLSSHQDITDEGDRLMTQEEYILEDFGWNLLRLHERAQYERYWPGFRKLDGTCIVFKICSPRDEPADAGWRVHLGLVLREIGQKSRRIEEIATFYQYWLEMVSK
jgi:hypothetical protein